MINTVNIMLNATIYNNLLQQLEGEPDNPGIW